MIVAPSILSADFAHLLQDIQKVVASGADWIHCDIMDGVFVPNISYGPMIVEQVNQMTDLPLDVHLMIVDPIRYVPQFAKAGADIITVHVDACEDVAATIAEIKNNGCSVGLALNPDKPLDLLLEYLDQVDLVLIMSVYAGFGGQVFIPESMEKVRELARLRQEQNYSFEIEVDGGINDQTAKMCTEAGATALVAGSYIFSGDDYRQRIDSLR